MNIVRWLGRKRVLSTLVLAALSAVGILFALTPQRVVVQPDRRWDPAIQKSIIRAIEDKPLRTLGARGLRAQLQDEYPCLQDVTIRYSGSLQAQVIPQGWKLRVTLCSTLPGNKVYVVCNKGPVLEKRYFLVKALQGLPTIEVKGTDFEQMRKIPELIEVARTLSSDLLDAYSITWYSKSKIKLRDKEHPIVIIADHASVTDSERYDYVQKIFSTERKYRRGMKADIRLKDSLVCAPHRKS